MHALDVPALDVTRDTPAAQIGFHLTFHTVARAVVTVEYSS